ncbi:MAG: lipoate--protein ligase family protein [Chloroflexaceae bacterium]|nr:lipoate--protein ligase family protein [Chloroflexaceae bacterium]
MKPVRVLDLGMVSPLRSQTVYHATGYALREDSPNTIILVSPSSPYVCVGYHQDLEQEVDLEYCRSRGLPVIRREVGGGAVYLDSGQIFAQWVFHPEDLPRTLEERFALYIRPIVETYQSLGVNAYLRPVNDIHVDGKKIGGTGAAQMGMSEVVVGSLMLTFDKVTMAKVLKVSSEKMRDKIFESLEQYMTTLGEQLVQVPDREPLKQRYLEQCRVALGAEIVPGEWTEEEERQAVELDARFTSDEWLYQNDRIRRAALTIHQGVQLAETALKVPGGLIRVVARIREGHLDDISLSGDFTILPSSAVGDLEQAVRGLSSQDKTLVARIEEVYRRLEITSPGVTPEDFATAIQAAIRKHQG